MDNDVASDAHYADPPDAIDILNYYDSYSVHDPEWSSFFPDPGTHDCCYQVANSIVPSQTSIPSLDLDSVDPSLLRSLSSPSKPHISSVSKPSGLDGDPYSKPLPHRINEGTPSYKLEYRPSAVSMRLKQAQEPDTNLKPIQKTFDLGADMQEVWPKERRVYNEEERLDTAATRRRGACSACKQSKRRCTHQDYSSHTMSLDDVEAQSSTNKTAFEKPWTVTYSPDDRLESPWSTTSTSATKRLTVAPDEYLCHFSGCDHRFSRHSDLSRHLKTHLPPSERPHPCPHCDASFLYPKDLRRHFMKHRIEPREPEYLCPNKDCDKSFRRRDNLTRHMRSKHSAASITLAFASSEGDASSTTVHSEASDASLGCVPPD